MDAISELYTMLQAEERLWDTTDKSKTVERIQKYTTFLFLIRNMFREMKFDGCLVAFGKYQASVHDLRMCFYKKEGKEEKRRIASELFNEIYRTILEKCKTE